MNLADLRAEPAIHDVAIKMLAIPSLSYSTKTEDRSHHSRSHTNSIIGWPRVQHQSKESLLREWCLPHPCLRIQDEVGSLVDASRRPPWSRMLFRYVWFGLHTKLREDKIPWAWYLLNTKPTRNYPRRFQAFANKLVLTFIPSANNLAS